MNSHEMNNLRDRLIDLLAKLGCNTGTIHRASDGLLHMVTSVGVPDKILTKIEVIPFGKGIAGAAAKTKLPVELCNLQSDLEGIAEIDSRQTGVSGSVAIPIISSSGMVVGTVGVGKYVPYRFTDEEKSCLLEFGKEIASTL